MKQIAGLACCLSMRSTEKFKPIDSAKDQKKDGQAVKDTQDHLYKQKEVNMPNPEKKRKFSEQPPTKRNAKT